MKKVLALIMALLLCVSMVACDTKAEVKDETPATEVKIQETTAPEQPAETEPTETEPEETEPVESQPENTGSTPLLYKVTDDFGDVIWLFGSIHVGWEEYYPLPDYVLDAFDSSVALAVEYDLVAFEKDYSAMVEAVTALLYMDGTKISDHIPQDLYDRAVAIMKENNSYSAMLDMYYPVFWYSAIENFLFDPAGADAELGIDRYMINMAYDADKPVLDVESAALQYGLLAGFSEELQLLLLESAVEGYEDLENSVSEMQALMTAWMNGDPEALYELVAAEPEDLTAEEQALLEEYNYALSDMRNIGMADFAADALEEGEEIFICVGAAHIVGPGGLVELLTEWGYTVEQVK